MIPLWWRLGAIAAALLVGLAVGGTVAWKWQASRVSHAEARMAELQRGAETAARQELQRQAEREARARANNDRLRKERDDAIRDADARGADLAARLLDARADAARSRALSEAGDRQRALDAADFARREGEIARAVAAYDAACQRDAAQLIALIGQLEPQL
ncbi:MAG: hypothetical protein IT518_20310 [Burkholderiales bacterium]|nr:hypothetical protein [Burkholderiales bacterium]